MVEPNKADEAAGVATSISKAHLTRLNILGMCLIVLL